MSRPAGNYTKIRICEFCGGSYSKNPKEGRKQFLARRFCSHTCASKALRIWENLVPYQFKEKHQVPIAWRLAISKANWRGGSKRSREVLESARYRNWRRKVFERDNYTCQICGYQGNKLVAHHIRSWSKFPILRFVINNGATLCESCHKNNICTCSEYRKEYGLEKHFLPRGI